MSAPTIVAAIDLGVPQPTDFVLDDATRGVLDGTTYVLASGYTPVTADSLSASITRGRFTQLWDSVDAGTCRLRLLNVDRDFDPTYAGSPYLGFVVPGRRSQITANGVAIWTGYVDDWDLEYSVDGMSTAIAVSTDGLGVLGHLQFDAWTSSPTTASGKLMAVMARPEVLWRDGFDFDEGLETLQADNVSWGSNVKNYCDLIARSDLGLFFAGVDGELKFRDRSTGGDRSVASFGAQVPLTDESGDYLTDAGGAILTGPGIPFIDIDATIGSELLFARVGVDREGGTNQTSTVSDTDAWMTNYGPLRSLSIPGLLLADDSQSSAMADYLLSLYDTPRYRIRGITVALHALSSAEQDEVLAVDISNTITVAFTPNDVGDSITQVVQVQGIRHEIRPAEHYIEFSLIDGHEPYFRLDSSDYGVLDVDLLGY